MNFCNSMARSIDRIGSFGGDANFHQSPRFFQNGSRLGRDHHHRLTDVQHFAVSQKWFVTEEWAEMFFARQVIGRENTDHAGERISPLKLSIASIRPHAAGLPTKPTCNSSARGGRSSMYQAVPVT